MDDVFKKMNFKGQSEILVVNHPASFQPNLDAMKGLTKIQTDVAKAEKIQFALAFVTKQNEVDMLAAQIAAKTVGDALVWFAYPKSTSKRYNCEFNRDTGWAALGMLGFEGVRQVAIDDDWSALRFRRVEYIKTMVRNEKLALSTEGRARVKK
ncbi:MAG: hypothetical protein KF734_09160 [Saprospiraceae bacterium]|nr:hypothetical protein [Saprospiraceae bacterium]